MELKHLTIAVATALGLSTAAMAQTGDMGKQRGTTSEPSASATQGMAASDDVRQVQQELQNRGFNVGTVDGVMGPQTKGALKEFQQAEGLPATGELNEKTKSQLKTSSAGSRASGTTGSTGASGTTGSRSSGPMTGSSSNPNAPSTNSSDSQGASSPATPGSAPRGGSAGSGVKGSPSPNSGTTGSTTTSPNTGAGSMTNPGGSPPKPSTDKPKTGDSSK
jgi:peptidoglycan hydrolase-like protein with peptidoglycan-binding domain